MKAANSIVSLDEDSSTRLPIDPLDVELPTLHIRCGTDIMATLSSAGFVGDFLSFADPYCLGPTPATNFLEARAGFLAEAFELSRSQAEARLHGELAGLGQAGQYPRVVLWFEHDPYDQWIQLRVLVVLGALVDGLRIERVPFPRPTEVGDPRSFGALDARDLRALWPRRSRVTVEEIEFATEVWEALIHPSPARLAAIQRRSTLPIPEVAGALDRFLRDLPWASDGLTFSERLCLRELAPGALDLPRLFRRFSAADPLASFGDSMLRYLLRRLTFDGLVTTSGESFELTLLGQRVLDGQVDRTRVAALDHWLAGTHLTVEDHWRWDEASGQPVRWPCPVEQSGE